MKGGICTSCIYHLPRTNFHRDPENVLAKQFRGRVRIGQAIAFVHFQKGNRVQRIMHSLKYRGRSDVAMRMGQIYGQELLGSEQWMRPELILPVPLHPSRQRARGYNQSEEIAKGLSEVLNIPFETGVLIRTTNTLSQTKKSRFERYENLVNSFKLKDPGVLGGKHILLVDDVVTTGATLEACCEAMKEVEELKISLGALAYAD